SLDHIKWLIGRRSATPPPASDTRATMVPLAAPDQRAMVESRATENLHIYGESCRVEYRRERAALLPIHAAPLNRRRRIDSSPGSDAPRRTSSNSAVKNFLTLIPRRAET